MARERRLALERGADDEHSVLVAAAAALVDDLEVCARNSGPNRVLEYALADGHDGQRLGGCGGRGC
jgi:hypothetical protein